MIIKVEKEGFKVSKEFEFEAKINESVVIASFGGIFNKKLQLALKPIKIEDGSLDFYASGKFTKNPVFKQEESGLRAEYIPQNKIYSLKKGEKICFSRKSKEGEKDRGLSYTIEIE